ncbi:cation:proton antiporter [Streptomonospora nanhaiensis]|uniref:cation:proton antiporter n=1 Tax=Streptomonospora nanhaiensis TaxID=1323731 RepID=UPI001C38E6AD|nr:sodium:proton antiporter [Streptomonospora nanhaiensis]MBV2365379.1 sodium:proton antiporter [Streptomonospora nanhaiensis]
MEVTLVVAAGVVSIVVVAALSDRLGVALPLSLVAVGIGLSFVPGVPHPRLDPEWVLAGVLPVLLYAAAVTMPVQDFRRDVGPITGLAVLLVVLTTLGTGWLFHAAVPGIGWPAAFALGAVVSPTDAVAATAVGRRLGLPSRLLTLLEGEGLVNDASALILLRTAVAASAAAVSVWGVLGDFLYAVAVSVLIGLAVGVVNVRVRGLLNDPVLNTAVSFVVPFVAFVPAEDAGASGVLAAVVAGLATGHLSPRHLAARDRLSEATNWRTLSFLLENAVFLLMGLSVAPLVARVAERGLDPWTAVGLGLAASAVVTVIRMAFAVPLVAVMRRDVRRARRIRPRLEVLRRRLEDTEAPSGPRGRGRERLRRRVVRASADAAFRLRKPVGWRGGVVLAWSGMRGAITLAAAQTLPADTPHRPLLVLVAFVVASATLLVQGFTLPAVIRAVKVPGDDPDRMRDDYAGLLAELSRAGAAVLADPAVTAPEGEPADPALLDRVRADSRVRSSDDEDDGLGVCGRDDDAARAEYVRLRRAVLSAQREALLAARGRGLHDSRALRRAQSALDVEEARLERFAG